MAKKSSFIKLAILTLLKALSVKMEEIKTDKGLTLFADIFEPGNPVFIMEQDTQIPLPVGEYILEDGRTLVVQEEGVIFSIAEAQPGGEGKPALGATAASVKPAEKSYTISEIKSLVDAGLSEQKETFEKKIAELETKLAEATKEPEEPPAEGVKPNPEGHDDHARVKLSARPKSAFERVCDNLYSN